MVTNVTENIPILGLFSATFESTRKAIAKYAANVNIKQVIAMHQKSRNENMIFVCSNPSFNNLEQYAIISLSSK